MTSCSIPALFSSSMLVVMHSDVLTNAGVRIRCTIFITATHSRDNQIFVFGRLRVHPSSNSRLFAARIAAPEHARSTRFASSPYWSRYHALQLGYSEPATSTRLPAVSRTIKTLMPNLFNKVRLSLFGKLYQAYSQTILNDVP